MSTSPLSRVGLPADDDTAAPSGGSRKLVLGVAGLLLAGLALVGSLLLGGSDELDDLGTPPVAAAAEPAATPAPSTSPSALAFPDDSTARDGRDLFTALYTEPRAAAGAPAGGTTEVPGAPAVPEAPEDGVVEPGSPEAPSPGSGPVTVVGPAVPSDPGALTIALLRTQGSEPSRSAVFTVDGAEVPVAVGESFGPAGGLLLLSLQQDPDAGGWTAVVQSGQGEPFDMATGVPVTVR